MTREARITALELATGPTDTDTEASALQWLSDEDIELKVREIVAKYDGAGEDAPAEVQKARKLLANIDHRRDWEKVNFAKYPAKVIG
jgi:hypothetical protein